MGDKSVEKKNSIFERLGHILPPSLQTMSIFLFLRLQRPQRLQHIELGSLFQALGS